MATLRYDVDVDTRRAEARIGAFALGMRQRITRAVRSLPEIEITADSTDAQRELAQVRADLIELGRQRIGVDIDAGAAQARLAELNARLVALQGQGDIQIDADTAAAVAALGLVEEQVDRLDGRTARVRVDVDRSLGDSIIQVTRLASALKTIALPAAALAMIPQVAALATSLADLSGAAGLLPAAGFAAAGAIGALAVGLRGVGDALGPGGTPAQLEKVEAAIAKLSPAARSAVQEIRGFGPAWSSLRLDVQEKLFAGLGGEINTLGRAYLPILKTGLAGVASELNLGAKEFAGWAKSGETTRNVGVIFDGVRQTMRNLAPATTNVAAAITDVGVVGMNFLPGLATATTGLTQRFREFVAQARESGQLQVWIQNGIDKVNQLGRIAGNVGSILGSIFGAANASGADFFTTVEKITGEVRRFLESTTGQQALAAFFTGLRDTVSALLPAVKAVATEIAQGIVTLAPRVAPLAKAFADTVSAAAPMVGILFDLVSAVLPPLSAALAFIGPLLAPIAVGFAAIALVSKGVAGVTTAVLGLRTAIQGLSTANLIFTALGLAAVAVAVMFDRLRDKSDELAKSVIDGSKSMQQAVDAEAESITKRAVATDLATNLQTEGIIATDHAITASEAHAQAVDKVSAALEEQIAKMGPVEAAQARVTIAQDAFNQAVRDFGPDSAQAQTAAANLGLAQDRLKAQTQGASDATKSLGDAIVETSKQSSAAANADVAYNQSLLSLADAQDRAAAAARDHTAGSRELEQADNAVMSANLAVADSARRQAEANAVASGATNVAELGAQAYKQELLRLADQASGPTRQSLLDMASGTDVAARAASTAELQAAAYKDQLGLLGQQATGPLAAAMATARQNFDTLGGAHATAQQQAQAQKDELQRLADMASGPLRTELLRMADQIRTLPDGEFTIIANGNLTNPTWGSGTGFGARPAPGLATGGILGGYTPGRDVHDFYSPTGGRLALSGGEAVMRPEWTRAVGSGWVDAANKAARTGGVAGVEQFMQQATPGGGVARYAMGGVIRGGIGNYPELGNRDYVQTRDAMVARLAAMMREAIKKAQAAQEALLAGGGPPGAGVERWRGMVGQALGIAGQPQTYQNITLRRMNQESGGNPTIVNRTDSNWTRGTPSVGLMQVIGPTYRAYKHPGYDVGPYSYGTSVNPLSNTLASMRYALARYGSLPAAYNKSGGYATGGVIPMRVGDRGGALSSGQAVMNLSGKVERLLNPGETRIYDAVRAAAMQPTAAPRQSVTVDSAHVAAEVAKLRSEIRALGDAVRSARPITVNDRSGDPTETARTAMVMLRLS